MAELLNAQRATEAQVYDFAQPTLLSQKQMEALLESLQTQAKTFQKLLAETLDLECELGIEEVVEVSSQELTMTPLDPAFDCQAATESGRILCCVDAQLAQLVVERVLGGQGTFHDAEREATDIETALMEQTLNSILRVWRTDGAASVEQPVSFIASTMLAKQPPVRGIRVQYSIRIGEETRPLRIFATYEDVTQIAKVTIGARVATTTAKENITTEHLRSTFFQVRAQVPPVPIRIRDLRQLQVGDVVQLDRKVTDEVQVAIGDKVVFVGHPGTRHGNVGIRISRAVGMNKRS